MEYKAILWDLDGTLLDTLTDLTGSVNYALSACGLPCRSREEVARFTGNGIRRLMERSVPQGCDPQVTERAFEAFRLHYAAHCEDTTRPYPGVAELLQKAREAGVKCAIVSNKAAFAVEELAKRWFPGTLAIGMQEGLDPKPAPVMPRAALARLGVGEKDALYIGDSEVDVATARNTGLRGIFVTWGFRSEETLLAAGARRIAHSVKELEKKLELE